MTTYRTGRHWGVTIVRESVVPNDNYGEHDELVAVVVNGDRELAERIAWLLTHACPTCTGPSRETVGMVCRTCGTDYAPGSRGEDAPSARSPLSQNAETGSGVVPVGVDDPSGCEGRCAIKTDPDCPIHQGRRPRGPKPPPVGPGCVCDGSGRTCPRHGAVI